MMATQGIREKRCVDALVILEDASCIAGVSSYNIVTVEGAAASRVFFHLKAEAVRMGE